MGELGVIKVREAILAKKTVDKSNKIKSLFLPKMIK